MVVDVTAGVGVSMGGTTGPGVASSLLGVDDSDGEGTAWPLASGEATEGAGLCCGGEAEEGGLFESGVLDEACGGAGGDGISEGAGPAGVLAGRSAGTATDGEGLPEGMDAGRPRRGEGGEPTGDTSTGEAD